MLKGKPAPCPQIIIDLAQGKITPNLSARYGQGTITDGATPFAEVTLDQVARATAYVRQCDPAISGQGGHAQTFKVACKLVKGFALSREDALRLLRDEYNPRCVPPWIDKDLEHKIDDALKQPGVNGHMLNDKKPHSNGQATVKPSPAKAIGATACSLQPKRVEWLWPGWIPLGKMSMLDGDPGLGKSSLLVDIAARVTTQGLMPNDVLGITGDVVIMSAEDDAEDTIIPRLIAAGADLRKVHFLFEVGKDVPPTIPQHVRQIEEFIADHDARLLIVDPLTAYLDADTCNDQKVRRALHPLRSMLQRRRCAMTSLRHLNKEGGTKALYRGGGSIAIIGAARAGMLVAEHPDNPQWRGLAQTKNNLAGDQPMLTYQLEWLQEYQACRVAWIPGQWSYSADDLLKPPDEADGKSQKEEAVEFLKALLQEEPRYAADIFRLAAPNKFGEKAIKYAKKILGVRSKPIKDLDGRTIGWQWSLPPGGTSGPSG
jgi:hypothetical protein